MIVYSLSLHCCRRSRLTGEETIDTTNESWQPIKLVPVVLAVPCDPGIPNSPCHVHIMKFYMYYLIIDLPHSSSSLSKQRKFADSSGMYVCSSMHYSCDNFRIRITILLL